MIVTAFDRTIVRLVAMHTPPIIPSQFVRSRVPALKVAVSIYFRYDSDVQLEALMCETGIEATIPTLRIIICRAEGAGNKHNRT